MTISRLPQARSLTEAQRNPIETRFLDASERWRLTRRRRGRRWWPRW
ncbi:MAG: hypothetical protein R3F60_24315 [bacterium]